MAMELIIFKSLYRFLPDFVIDIIVELMVKQYLIAPFYINVKDDIFRTQESPCIGDNFSYKRCEDCTKFADGVSISGIISYNLENEIFENLSKKKLFH
jgi:hypothetical protein